MQGPKLKNEHKNKLRAYAIADHGAKPFAGEQMMQSLEGRLTEAYLDGTLAAAANGTLDAFLDSIEKEKEEQGRAMAMAPVTDTAGGPPSASPPSDATSDGSVLAEGGAGDDGVVLRAADVDAAVAEAVANATEEEKKVGFWARDEIEVDASLDDLPEPAEPEPVATKEEAVAAVVEAVDDNLDAAVKDAEKEQTEDEQKTGFWKRVGGFFTGIFSKKKAK